MNIQQTLLELEPCLPSPLQKIEADILQQKSIQLYIKRDDLIHPLISGNKWRKLKFNLLQAEQQGYDTLLSFGGAYSNHIHALAAAGKAFGFKTIGIIRGDEPRELNHTLRFAVEQGMALHFVDRETYRQKHSSEFQAALKKQFGEVYILPEGGSNQLALPGCAEIVDELVQQLPTQTFSIVTACGSGGTAAGLLSHPSVPEVTGVAVLKGAGFLADEVQSLLKQQSLNFNLVLDYHYGGYARYTPQLETFIADFKNKFGIPLEPIYTGKMLFALFDMIKNDKFAPGTNLVALHTGGLQGYQNERF
ncbi:MAG: pyridoxal-phosphate dependent enzyme [Gammaproteobacteria bacterium]|nr:pyridoxal-phosphate dependent enzyme [Gammaproteobacteria bacterium]